MRRSTNLWHDAICEHLRAAGEPLSVEQIWGRMKVAGFQHTSKKPRQTLGGRLAELVQMNRLERVGPATYKLLSDTQSAHARQSQGSS